ncbi:hypothetical protein HJC23_003139 [Cyclotella cryptica]|uniref:DNL-type domain-containing protein n=1 Tax=Cyclotella cryptica TaxID=29204 RepID=A0ABD3P517_9STRA|eukprot:CCRYP_017536-RA/>CCRYP_017536-RA protein AED:0.22 eAED:-0.40 QI:0/-1/0/1/-1/1/1/0/215
MWFSLQSFICVLTTLATLFACEAFAPHHKAHHWPLTSLATASNNEEQPDTTADSFALPSVGASSFWDRQPMEDNSIDGGNSLKSNGITIRDEVASPKFQLQYTCKICSTRNSHKVSRMAYRKGVVIVVCKECESKHLIADNLGWSNYIGGFDFDNGERNIEQFMKNRNEESEGGEELVLRVDKDVFDLEKVLYNRQEEESSVSSLENGNNLDHWN